MSRYLYKKIQNISPESLNFQHSGLKLTTLVREYHIGNTIYRVKVKSNGQTQEEPKDTIKRLIQRNTKRKGQI